MKAGVYLGVSVFENTQRAKPAILARRGVPCGDETSSEVPRGGPRGLGRLVRWHAPRASTR